MANDQHAGQCVLYTDGGCHGNPGPGAWAFVLETPTGTVRLYGAESDTTNNRMELSAVIEGLEYIRLNTECRGATICRTDSRYVQQGITDWIRTWKRNGWRTAGKKAVKNQDLWKRLDALVEAIQPSWEWVRGHAGEAGNEECDALVQQGIRELNERE
jgi:ribonuclease HI